MMSAKKLILLIEDNPDDEQLTLRTLRRHNVDNEVVVAGDGKFALDYLFRQGEHSEKAGEPLPELIILDLSLPGMDGIEVLRRIREAEVTSLIPVVVLTGSDDQAKVQEAYRCGANSFVVKPQGHQEFSDVILNTAMYWLLLNETP